MKELKASGISQSIGMKVLFDGVDLSLQSGDKVGLIGINGTGKTTLLDTLVGLNAPESGQITSPKDYKIAYLKQANTLDQELTVLQTVFAGDNLLMNTVRDYEEVVGKLNQDPMNEKLQNRFTKMQQAMDRVDGWTASSQAQTILTKLGIYEMDKCIYELSGGQQKRVQLAQVLIQQSDLLILDEPTNHLDYEMIAWLEKFLSQYKGALLLVTHDRYFLDHVVQSIVELSGGQLHRYSGNYQDYVQERAHREELAAEQAHKANQLYKQELAWMREGVRARGTKQQARKDRFEDLKETVQNQTTRGTMTLNLAGSRLGKKVLELQEASFARNGKQLLQQLDLLIQADTRLGITGENGSGKTTLLNILAGRQSFDSGQLEVGETVKIAYYTQTNEGMTDDLRVIDYVREMAEEVTMANGSVASAEQVLEQFLFPRSMQQSYISSLSGGEKRRLYLARLLMTSPNVLLLDEPTNDLDTETLTILEEYIDHFTGAVIAVSHDRYFLDKTCEKLLIFEGAGQLREYWGKVSDYLKEANDSSARRSDKTAKSAQDKSLSTSETSSSQEKTRLTYMEKKEWETIEDEITKLEDKIEAVEQEMLEVKADDYGMLNELNGKKQELEAALEEKIVRWEYLAEFV